MNLNRYYFFQLILATLTIFLLQALSGCAPPKSRLREKTRYYTPTPRNIQSSQVWSGFKNKHSRKNFPEKGFRLKGSINLSTPDKDRRMKFIFWGNYNYPLRIDLNSGLGSTFALWRITEKKWKAYFPSREIAYTHTDPTVGTAKLGLPLPFSFKKLAFILNGGWSQLIPRHYKSARYNTEKKCWEFFFKIQSKIQSLKLDKNGYPIEITGKSPFDWKISFNRYFKNKPKAKPQKLVLRLKNNTYRSVLRIQDEKSRKNYWSPELLDLRLPKNTEIISLKKEKHY